MTMQNRKRENIERVKKFASIGYSIPEIAKATSLSEYTVREYFKELGYTYKIVNKMDAPTKQATAVTRADIERFKAGLKPGSEVCIVTPTEVGQRTVCRGQTAIVISVSRNVVLTDKGCFQAKELYLWGR